MKLEKILSHHKLLAFAIIIVSAIYVFFRQKQNVLAAAAVTSSLGPLAIDPNDPKHFWQIVVTSAPTATQVISDTITVVKDNGNKIPAKSWMLYIFITHTNQEKSKLIGQNKSAEIDLISQFDGQSYFEAVFAGVNRHRFKIPVIVGHTYNRVITIFPSYIQYLLTDVGTKKTEIFSYGTTNFIPLEIHQGIEYHNLSTSGPFPARYDVTTTKPIFTANTQKKI